MKVALSALGFVLIVWAPSVSAAFVPNDNAWANQWWAKAAPGARFNEAWDQDNNGVKDSLGSDSVLVAIIDVGFLKAHPDLQSHWFANDAEVNGLDCGAQPEPECDDDGNGYYDDKEGWDFIGDNWNLNTGPEDNNPFSDSGTDLIDENNGGDAIKWHGTEMAGIVAATINNNVWIAGAAQVKILPLRMHDGGHDQAFRKAVEYATAMGADIILTSQGVTSGRGSAALDDAYAHDIFITAAAGQWRSGPTPCGVAYPARHDAVVAVGAIDSSGAHYSTGCEGPEMGLTAPGVTITTTAAYTNSGGGISSSVADVTGTSFAAPMVAGAAALMKSYSSELTGKQIREILQATAVDLGDAGKDDVYGYGRLDAAAALRAAVAATGAFPGWNSPGIQAGGQWPGIEEQPATDIDQLGNTHMVYVGTNEQVRYAVMDQGGAVIYGPVEVEAGSSYSGLTTSVSVWPDIAIDANGIAHIVWVDWFDASPTSAGDIMYAKWSMNGQVLAPQKADITNSGDSGMIQSLTVLPELGPGNPNAYVVFDRSWSDIGHQIELLKMDSGGSVASGYPAVLVTSTSADTISDGFPSAGMIVDSTSGTSARISVAWERYEGYDSNELLCPPQGPCFTILVHHQIRSIFWAVFSTSGDTTFGEYMVAGDTSGWSVRGQDKFVFASVDVDQVTGVTAIAWLHLGYDSMWTAQDGSIEFAWARTDSTLFVKKDEPVAAFTSFPSMSRPDVTVNALGLAGVSWAFGGSVWYGRLGYYPATETLTMNGNPTQHVADSAAGYLAFPTIACARGIANSQGSNYDTSQAFRLVWMYGAQTPFSVAFASTSPTFAFSHVRASPMAVSASNPDVAYDPNGGMHVVFEEVQVPNPSKVHYQYWPAGSTSPSTDVLVPMGLTPASQPHVVATLSASTNEIAEAHIAFVAQVNGESHVWMTRYASTGNQPTVNPEPFGGDNAAPPAQSIQGLRIEKFLDHRMTLTNPATFGSVQQSVIGAVWTEVTGGLSTVMHGSVIVAANAYPQMVAQFAVKTGISWGKAQLDYGPGDRLYFAYMDSGQHHAWLASYRHSAGGMYTKVWEVQLDNPGQFTSEVAIKVDRDFDLAKAAPSSDPASNDNEIHVVLTSDTPGYGVLYMRVKDRDTTATGWEVSVAQRSIGPGVGPLASTTMPTGLALEITPENRLVVAYTATRHLGPGQDCTGPFACVYIAGLTNFGEASFFTEMPVAGDLLGGSALTPAIGFSAPLHWGPEVPPPAIAVAYAQVSPGASVVNFVTAQVTP